MAKAPPPFMKGKSDPKTAKAVQSMLKKTGRDTATPVSIGPEQGPPMMRKGGKAKR